MINDKIILNNLEQKYINILIKICQNNNIEYEVIGFNKQILMIYNTKSHKYFNNFTKCIDEKLEENQKTNDSIDVYHQTQYESTNESDYESTNESESDSENKSESESENESESESESESDTETNNDSDSEYIQNTEDRKSVV